MEAGERALRGAGYKAVLALIPESCDPLLAMNLSLLISILIYRARRLVSYELNLLARALSRHPEHIYYRGYIIFRSAGQFSIHARRED